jgi:hypothetical protein
MPTERIDPKKPKIVMDRETEKLVADFFQDVYSLNPQRLAIQCGTFGPNFYVVHVRFKDLKIPAVTGGMPIMLHVEHLLDMPETATRLHRPLTRGDLPLWLLGDPLNYSLGVFPARGVLQDTLRMAHAEYTVKRKRRWPDGFPQPKPDAKPVTVN